MDVYVNDRTLRDQFIDHLIARVLQDLRAAMDDPSNTEPDEYFIAVDSVGTPLRLVDEPRVVGEFSSDTSAYPITDDGIEDGEGDVKAKRADAKVRRVVSAAPPSSPLSQISTIIHFTNDSDALPIMVTHIASLVTHSDEPSRLMDPSRGIQTIVVLETTRGPRHASYRDYYLVPIALLYKRILDSIDPDLLNHPARAEVAIAAMVAGWALCGCDFVDYKYPKVRNATNAMCAYLKLHGTEPFNAILDWKTAKSASGSLAAVCRDALGESYTYMKNDDGKRIKMKAPLPTNAHLAHAIWASLYWRCMAPPSSDNAAWYIYTEGIASSTGVHVEEEEVPASSNNCCVDTIAGYGVM